jgi:hypothetical protein
VGECDAIAVARGVAPRHLQELEGYSEGEALAALEWIMPRAYGQHPPPPETQRAIC